MGRIKQYRADPGRDNLVRSYFEVWTDLKVTEDNARMAQCRGDRRQAAQMIHMSSRHSQTLHNMFDEMTTAERKAASKVIKKFQAGYNILWRPQSAMAGFGCKWKRL